MRTTTSLAIALQTGIPVMLWGAPGTGKTKTIESIGKAVRRWLEVLIGATREPSDFGGVPVVNRNGDGVEIIQAPLAWAKRLMKQINPPGILFLDEISCCPPAVFAVLLRVVLDKYVGEFPLPENTWVVAAGNPPDQAAAGMDLPAPLANRFIHLYWVPNVIEWCDGMLQGWPEISVSVLPSNWRDHLTETKNMVQSYIRFQQHKLNVYPKEASGVGKAWPSGRTWEMTSICMAACRSVGAAQDIEVELISGCIGDAFAIEFIEWQRALDLPSPIQMINNPKTLDKILKEGRGDRIYAALGSLLAFTLQSGSIDVWNKAWVVIAHVAASKADIACQIAFALARSKPPGKLIYPEVQVLDPILRKAGIT